MKLAIILCFVTSLGLAQRINIENGNMDIYVDSTMSVYDAEKMFNKFDLTGPIKHYDRYIYSKNATYYRPGIGVFRKPRIYRVENGNLIKLNTRSF